MGIGGLRHDPIPLPEKGFRARSVFVGDLYSRRWVTKVNGAEWEKSPRFFPLSGTPNGIGHFPTSPGLEVIAPGRLGASLRPRCNEIAFHGVCVNEMK
jgi:hypothetical protein